MLYVLFYVQQQQKAALHAASESGAANNVQRIAQIQLLKKKFCYATMQTGQE
jgi:cell division protein FtsB